jgi:hypothetical protein
VLNTRDLDQVLQMRKQAILRVAQVESIDRMCGLSRNGKGATIGDSCLVIEQHSGPACTARMRGDAIKINKVDGHLGRIGVGYTILEPRAHER